jgi:hypothetical protein
MMVPSSNFIRWLGLAALIGGGVGALLGLLGPLLFSYLYSPLSSESEIQSYILFYTDHIQLLALLLGAMAAIAALHTLQSGAYGLLGKLTSLTAFFGVALIFGGAVMELLVGIGQRYSDVISMLIVLPLILGLLAVRFIGSDNRHRGARNRDYIRQDAAVVGRAISHLR